MASFESAFQTIKALAQDFKENEKRYLTSSYQEAEVRRDFIDKFFDALGWDVYHNTQKNPYEQEVKVEKGVSVGITQKRADYAFYISPEFRAPKFFAEAKKPSRNLKNADDYFQTIRYGWNANTPVAVLTDFEEFHILDCRIKPNIKSVLDNPNHKSYTFEDYSDEKKFAEIYYLFSREAVSNNSLEKYAELFTKGKSKKADKTTKKVSFKAIDDDFLEYIDDVREVLAKAFKKNDVNLSSEELTEATQRTIDRIVFIRFLEDKLIEPEYYISEFGKKGNAWADFISVCRKLDAKYNGIVFKKHFIDEQNFAGPEQSSFKKICDEISYLNSPYDFNAIPVHILGSIYERFLGKVVNATDKRVKVEEKPEVRKAGGVYYTPKYIVDYIVDNTVGKILRNEEGDEKEENIAKPSLQTIKKGTMYGKTPAEIAKLRFADIACGSGSFLIGVFETLLKYHTEYYQSHPEEAKKDGCKEKDRQWVLSIKQKQKILQNNIYGVDIDQQAVEVTQLSLALKMLEDESTATANDMQALFHEKILPDLSRNIVCGNSLIGTDILEGKMFASDEERKLNPMDFETTFPEVFKNGGFDAIVGNPPYVRIQALNEYANEQVTYFNDSYRNIVSDSYDIYLLFIYKGNLLLNSNGVLGFITPHKFFTAIMGRKLRTLLSQDSNVVKIISFGTNQVFKSAITYTCLLFISKKENKEMSYYEFKLGENISNLNSIAFIRIENEQLKKDSWNFTYGDKANLIEKITSNGLILGDIALKIFKGSSTGNDDIFLLKLMLRGENTSKYYSKILQSEVELENDLMQKFIYGEDVRKYYIKYNDVYLLFPYEKVNDNYSLIEIQRMREQYPLIYSYLSKNKSTLLQRKVSLTSDSFYKYSAARSLNEYCQGKILVPDMLIYNRISIDEQGTYFHGPAVHSLIFNETVKNYNMKYFLGILNSKVFWFYISNISTALRGNAYRLTPEYLKNYSFPSINFSNKDEIVIYNKIISLVGQIIDSKKQMSDAIMDKDITYYKRKCESLDSQIDQEVFKLYGLTLGEIQLVKNN